MPIFERYKNDLTFRSNFCDHKNKYKDVINNNVPVFVLFQSSVIKTILFVPTISCKLTNGCMN